MSEPLPTVLELVTQIVSAHCASSTVAAEALPALIRQVHAALTQAGGPEQAITEKPEPAVPPRKSVFPDYIVCLEDGKKLKMLKRHLKTHYGLTPERYREKWDLPSNYPMVAPNHAERRSDLARQIGLGRKPGAEAGPEQEGEAGAPPRRGRAHA